MEKPTGEQSDAAAGNSAAGAVPEVAPGVLEYARPHTAGPRLPPGTDSMDVVAGCAFAVVALLSTVGAIGLLTAALFRLMSSNADPFGPAFLFCGALLLAAVAVTCWRVVLPAKASGDGVDSGRRNA